MLIKRFIIIMARTKKRKFNRDFRRNSNYKNNNKRNKTFKELSEEDINKLRSECKLSFDFTNENINNFNGIEEEDVGISTYLSPSIEGFTAILKHRQIDFVVKEVDLDNNIATITLPLKDDEGDEKNELNNDIDLGYKLIEDVFNIECVNKLKEFVSENKKNSEFLFEKVEKDQRKNIHQIIREHFPSFISDTVDGCVRVRPRTAALDRHEKKCYGWPKDRPEYLKFVLKKQDIDTIQAVSKLCYLLGIRNNNVIQYAGTKDRRAVTYQFLTASRLSKERVKRIDTSLKSSHKFIEIGNMKYVNESLYLGALSGNQFTIALRYVKSSKDILNNAVKSLADNGFINYFGLQRFGSIIPTYLLGKALLNSNYAKLISLLLTTRNGEQEKCKEAREYFMNTRDIHGALQRFPRFMSAERAILQGMLKGDRNNFSTAIDSLPRNLRNMYLHSYQSYIWNKVVSHRINIHGRKVVVGDLIKINSNINSDPQEYEIKELNQDDINANKYKLTDIVVPVPGYESKYPTILKDLYAQYLAEDGFTFDSFHTACQKFKLKGAYRELVIIPKDVEHVIVPYNDTYAQLFDVDSQELKILKQTDDTYDFNALVIRFFLPSSTYATMCIRELLKISSSYSSLQKMNSAYKNEIEIKQNDESEIKQNDEIEGKQKEMK